MEKGDKVRFIGGDIDKEMTIEECCESVVKLIESKLWVDKERLEVVK